MSDAISFRLLRTTPMRDIVRGRLTGRLDWRARVAAAALPAPAADVIRRVVGRTRLWSLERAGVADELIAHFADGLAAGTSADALVRGFGDEGDAAALIRRAVKRGRPLAWHALRYAEGAAAVLALLYGAAALRFYAGEPSIGVTYVEQLAATTRAMPDDARAWPIYREALIDLGLTFENDPAVYPWTRFEDSQRDAVWPQMTAYLDAHARAIELLHAAAAKPSLGFIVGPEGSADDPTLGWPVQNYNDDAARIPRLDGSRALGLMPDAGVVYSIALVLSDDARLAGERGDAARLEANLRAMRGLARQLRGATLREQRVSIEVETQMLDTLQHALAHTPALLDDARLRGLAHTIADDPRDTAAELIDLSGERIAFAELLERTYTDDGDGDGRLTVEGARFFGVLDPPRKGIARFQTVPPRQATSVMLALATPASLASSRRAVADAFEQVVSEAEARLERPAREVLATDPAPAAIDRLRRALGIAAGSHADLQLTQRIDRYDEAHVAAEQLLGAREGTLVGLTLEAYRRRHGAYPQTLGALVPATLPRVPTDRVTGGPIRYRLVDGVPVVYSVGVDGDDDGGLVPFNVAGYRYQRLAARWSQPTARSELTIDGDWVIYDARP